MRKSKSAWSETSLLIVPPQPRAAGKRRKSMPSEIPTGGATSGQEEARRPAIFDLLWRWAAQHPLVAAVTVLAAQTLPALWSRDLYNRDELRHAGVLFEVLEHGNWLALHLNGEFYPDKPPIYFWLLAAASWIFQTDRPPIFFLVTALTAAICLIATYAMARLVVRGDRELGLMACLVLLTTAYFIEASHYPRMDLLFAAFIALGLASFFVACNRDRAPGWMLAGFGWATLAALTKGPLGLIIPLLTACAYLAWRGRLSRLLSFDVVAGAGLSIALLGLYLWGLYREAGLESLESMLGYLQGKAISDRGFKFHLGTYLYWHAARWLPWTLLLLFLPWQRLLNRTKWASTWRTEDEATLGWVFLGLSVACAIVPLSFMSYRKIFFLLTVYPALSVIAAGLIRSFPPAPARRFATTIAAILLVLGLALPLLSFDYSIDFPVRYSLWSGLLAIAGALLLFRFRSSGMAGTLLILTLCATAAMQPHFIASLRDYQHFKGTRTTSETVARLADQGYSPLVLGPSFGGFFQYYAGRRLPELSNWAELEQELRLHDRAVILMRGRRWDDWSGRPQDARVLYSTDIRIDHKLVIVGAKEDDGLGKRD